MVFLWFIYAIYVTFKLLFTTFLNVLIKNVSFHYPQKMKK